MALLKICAVMIVAVAMNMALAHALELPGKLRLSKEQYLAVQAIYYPGFTFGGITEPLGVIVTALLVWLLPAESLGFWLTIGACVALMLMHATYWLMIPSSEQFLAQRCQPARRRRGFLCVQLRKAGSVRTNGLDLSARSLGILPPRTRRFGRCGICPLGHCRGARLKI